MGLSQNKVQCLCSSRKVLPSATVWLTDLNSPWTRVELCVTEEEDISDCGYTQYLLGQVINQYLKKTKMLYFENKVVLRNNVQEGHMITH